MRKIVALALIALSTFIFTACNQETMAEMKLTPEKGDTIATIRTNKGDISLLLYTDQVPQTTKNFIELSKKGKFNDVIFHRVIKDFMIQTGDFENANGTGGYSYKGPGTTIVDEFDPVLKHIKGAVSMANRGPNTGGSQFFIVQAEEGTPWLDGAHAVFGYVYEGMDVVDEIGNTETVNELPTEEIKIKSVEIEKF
ncbi:peptidylprolyl isomerase [Candidatus Peregrinibacteria bacterium]|nr:peptidylprolyl isomerase [Candidatus Peregrinibacteria bacterium]